MDNLPTNEHGDERQTMNIVVYTMGHNEAKLIPYFVRHYSQFAKKIIYYDHGSTDNSIELLQSYPNVEVRSCFSAFFTEEEKVALWKIAECECVRGVDWMIVVDVDEFLYHPDILGLLVKYKKHKINVPLVSGFNMISKTFPTSEGQLTDEVQTGYINFLMNKPCVYDPSAIRLEYTFGQHFIRTITQGKLAPSHMPFLKLLHYRDLSPEYIFERNQRRLGRYPNGYKVSTEDIELTQDEVHLLFEANLLQSFNVINAAKEEITEREKVITGNYQTVCAPGTKTLFGIFKQQWEEIYEFPMNAVLRNVVAHRHEIVPVCPFYVPKDLVGKLKLLRMKDIIMVDGARKALQLGNLSL